MLLSHLSLNFRQLVKDRQILAAEVMKEYDKKFVYKKIFGGKVDRGVQTSQGEFLHHRSRCEAELIFYSRDDLLGSQCQHHAWLSSTFAIRMRDIMLPVLMMGSRCSDALGGIGLVWETSRLDGADPLRMVARTW